MRRHRTIRTPPVIPGSREAQNVPLQKGGIVRSTWNESYIRGSQPPRRPRSPKHHAFCKLFGSTRDWVLTLLTVGKSITRLRFRQTEAAGFPPPPRCVTPWALRAPRLAFLVWKGAARR